MTGVRGSNNLMDATRQWLHAFDLIASLIPFLEVPSYSNPWNEKQTRSDASLYSCVIGSYVRLLCGRPPVSSRPRGLLSHCSARRSMIVSSPFRTKEYEDPKYGSRLKYGTFHSEWVIREYWAKLGLSVTCGEEEQKEQQDTKKVVLNVQKLSKCWTTKRGQRWKGRKSRSHRRSKNSSSHKEIDYFLHTIVHFVIKDKHDLPFQYISAFILSITPLYSPWLSQSKDALSVGHPVMPPKREHISIRCMACPELSTLNSDIWLTMVWVASFLPPPRDVWYKGRFTVEWGWTVQVRFFAICK